MAAEVKAINITRAGGVTIDIAEDTGLSDYYQAEVAALRARCFPQERITNGDQGSNRRRRKCIRIG